MNTNRAYIRQTLLSDASSVFDVIIRQGESRTEINCLDSANAMALADALYVAGYEVEDVMVRHA